MYFFVCFPLHFLLNFPHFHVTYILGALPNSIFTVNPGFIPSLSFFINSPQAPQVLYMFLSLFCSCFLSMSMAAFMLILRGQNQRFETLIQNADPKRRSREYCLCFPREEDDFVSMHCALFEAIVRAQVNRKGVYMTSFKRGYMWFCVHCFHQNQRFALTTIVNAHFWAFWISVLKRRLFENKHGRNSVLLLPRLKTLILASKVKHERTPVLNRRFETLFIRNPRFETPFIRK